MAVSALKMELQLSGPEDSLGGCFDEGAPFDLRHAGKIVTPDPLQVGAPPRNHCLVTQSGTAGLFLLRYTPLCNNFLSSLDKVTSSPDIAAELHERHLNKLGSLGLYPWFTDIRPGTPVIDDRPGLFIIQRLLPDDADIGLSKDDDCELMELRLSQYLSWVSANREPAFLYDIDEADQYSHVGSDIVLHDVEPLYTTRPT